MNNVTVIMPYWERFEVAEETICHWRNQEGYRVDIIVVDDGSPNQPFHSDKCQVVSLPRKEEPKTPVLPYNIGVNRSSTELVILSGCDIRPRHALVDEMVDAWNRSGENSYIQPAVRGPNGWHAHSSFRCEYFPPGFNPNFCCLLSKDFFMNVVGGFSLDYRRGQAFDDTDFAWRLKEAGANPICRDDLVCDHIKDNARTQWPEGAWNRNFGIFKSRWKNAVK